MARFMEIKTVNRKLGKEQVAKELGCSSSTPQRYRQDINMNSPYRVPPNKNKRKQKISNREHDLDRPQMTSKDLKRRQLTANDLAEPEKTHTPSLNVHLKRETKRV